MPDLIQKHSSYGQLWPLQPAWKPELGRIMYAWSNFPCPIQFRFTKEGMDLTVQNQPRSDLVGLVSVWWNASGL